MKHIKTSGTQAPLPYERGADRFNTELAVEMAGVPGLTRNISASGIYFETESAQVPGSRVCFTVEVHARGEKFKLACEGEVVRVDRCGGVLGIAAKLERSFFSDLVEVVRLQSGSGTRIH